MDLKVNWTRVKKKNKMIRMENRKGQLKRIKSLYQRDIFVSFFQFLFERGMEGSYDY